VVANGAVVPYLDSRSVVVIFVTSGQYERWVGASPIQIHRLLHQMSAPVRVESRCGPLSDPPLVAERRALRGFHPIARLTVFVSRGSNPSADAIYSSRLFLAKSLALRALARLVNEVHCWAW